MELALAVSLALNVFLGFVVYFNINGRRVAWGCYKEEREHNHELVDRMLNMRREGFTPDPDTEPLEHFAFDNEYELAVETRRLEDKDEPDPDYKRVLGDF